jgi:DNA-binding Lrp family transcriptional regulator
MPQLDRIDRAILTALQNNARLSNKELASQVGLAPSSCLMRVRKLESDGVIQGYQANLAPDALGLGLQALIAVQLRLHVGEAFGNIGEHLRSLPEAVAVYCLGGTTDFLVHVVCRDTDHLRRLTILSFTSRPEVSRIETSLVFSYARLGLPVDHAHGVGIPPKGGFLSDLPHEASRAPEQPRERGGRTRRARSTSRRPTAR